MKRRYAVTVLMVMMFLVLGAVPLRAETEDIQTEYVSITDENRYKKEYYQKPQVRYPLTDHRAYRAAEEAQDLEQYIVEALGRYQAEIDVSDYQISLNDNIIFRILNNHPEFFYVSSTIGRSYSPQTNTIASYKITYLGTPEEIDRQRQELEAAAAEAAAQTEPSMTEVEKALVVHDYLAQNCEYDYDRLNSGQLPEISHTAYGALVNRMAVCDGYGDAYLYIMKNKLGIPCELVASEVMAHAWNMIEIGGKWYHVDVTWDDPVRDCIGRVGHNNFLLSDAAIASTSPEGHRGWSTSRTADSTVYDTAFWKEITSSICSYQGDWYYSRYKSGDYNTTGVQLLKKSGLLNGAETEVYQGDVWTGENNSFYPLSYMYPVKANDMLYFNTRTAIYRLQESGGVEQVFEPQVPSGQWIYGFTIRGKELWYALQSGPATSGKQEILTYALPELDLPELTGISAEDLTEVYNKNAHRITVSGIQEGDEVQYAGDDGVYSSEQPQLINAGVYQVYYRVKRRGYQPFEGTAQVTITKAMPVYTVPAGLTGFSGTTLADITLPEGFAWQTDTETKLYEEGSKIFLAVYTPADSGNYETVADIEIEVAVSCPGHAYTSEITKEPSATENGEETFTCTLCGHSYKQIIDTSLPVIEGVQAENIKVTYNGKAQRIQVLGIQTGDLVKYALGDGAYQEEQPELINAGVYQVRYRVERQGYQPFGGIAEVEITKAVPVYTAPVGLRGTSGKTLASVALPKGFAWQANSAVKLSEEGVHSWKATYTPEDVLNYETVSGIEVKVTVTCPGHQYQYRVTRPATETQKGLRTGTCSLCKHTYTEDIPMLESAKPGRVSGIKVTRNTVNTLAFSWNLAEHADGYRLLLYKGKTLVSEQYTQERSCSYRGLKAAAAYTLRIMPYRVVNGGRVYAASAGEIKTATAPASAKLNAARKGRNKVKLTWKKVSGASGYEIYMKTGKGSFKKIKNITKGKTVSFTKSGLKKRMTYCFRIRTYKTVGKAKVYGTYSKIKIIKIP